VLGKTSKIQTTDDNPTYKDMVNRAGLMNSSTDMLYSLATVPGCPLNEGTRPRSHKTQAWKKKEKLDWEFTNDDKRFRMQLITAHQEGEALGLMLIENILPGLKTFLLDHNAWGLGPLSQHYEPRAITITSAQEGNGIMNQEYVEKVKELNWNEPAVEIINEIDELDETGEFEEFNKFEFDEIGNSVKVSEGIQLFKFFFFGSNEMHRFIR